MRRVQCTRQSAGPLKGAHQQPMPTFAFVKFEGPFDLQLSLRAAASFYPRPDPAPRLLRLAVPIGGEPAVVEIRQTKPCIINACSTIPVYPKRLHDLASWLVSGDLDLLPFYRIAIDHPIMSPVVKRLNGLKPLRPASLFEMGMIAITEQQLSLAAAFHIRARLVERFAEPLDNLRMFPTPESIANASLEELRDCGLSRQRAEYVKGFAQAVSKGGLTFDDLKRKTDAEIREQLLGYKGFGEWSVQYVLMRGFGRPDCLPLEDIGLRRVIGMYLSHDRYLSPEQLGKALSPFTPFRGLAAFYLSVDARLRPHSLEKVRP